MRKTKTERKAIRKRIEGAKRRAVNVRKELRNKRRKNPASPSMASEHHNLLPHPAPSASWSEKLRGFITEKEK